MTDTREFNRRTFIGKSAGLSIGLTAANQVFSPSVLGANDRIVMGIIGPGGRGRGLMRLFLNEGVAFAAVSDTFKMNEQRALEMLDGKARAYADYRDLLDRSDIDAVLIATPEHQHCPNLIDAVDAGKDAYCEKPMSHSIQEGVKMIKEVRDTDRIVQIGMQRRSSEAVRNAKKIVEDGVLGPVNIVRAQWHWNIAAPLNNRPLGAELDWKRFCQPARVTEFEPKKYRYWRYFWDFSGGNVTDQGTHLMDVVQWFMNSGTPQAAECFGGVYQMTGAETPDVFSAIYDYGSFIATWTLVYTNKFDDGWSIMFQGKNGTLILDGRGYRVFEEPWESNKKPNLEFKGGIPTEPHVRNFLECTRTRNEPNAPVEIGHTAVCGPHLSNVAFHRKRRAYLNEDATRVRT